MNENTVTRDDSYHKRSILSKILAFSEEALGEHLPYTHRALAIYLDADRFTQQKKAALLGEMRGELEKLIQDASVNDASWTIKALAATDYGCFKQDLETLADLDESKTLFREFLYWSIIEHFSFVEKMVPGLVGSIPFERNQKDYFRVVARYGALATGNRFVIHEDNGSVAADEQIF